MWKHDVTFSSHPMLTDFVKVDVAIVGAGITGMTAAYLLSKSGLSVIVLEKSSVGSGATSYTTGFLCQVIDTDLTDAERIWGSETAKTILEGHKVAIDMIADIATKEKIECEFTRCSNYIYTTESPDHLQGECAVAERLGLSAHIIESPTLGFPAHRAIEVKHQAKFHPLKYLHGLAEASAANGVRIFEHTCVRDIEEGHLLYTDHGLVEAEQVFFATHEPFEQPLGLLFKKGAYVTHVLELQMPAGVLTEGTYEDTGNPYHYFRVDTPDGMTRVLVGGEDHRKNIPLPKKKSEAALERFAKETFGHLPYTVCDHWNGLILEPSDGLPIIGPYEYVNTFYASGFSGNGLTYGTLAARMFVDHVRGHDNPWRTIFDARRIPSFKGLAVKGRDYIAEFFGAVRNMLHRPHTPKRPSMSSTPRAQRVQ